MAARRLTAYRVHVPYEPPASLATLSIEDAARMIAADPWPPVETWHPAHCGHSGMRITADGRWLHDGRDIARPAMRRAFARLLRTEPDGRFALVTPTEHLIIDVDDAPFQAVELAVHGTGATMTVIVRLDCDALVIADAAHPFIFRPRGDAIVPYLTVRPGLYARATRAVALELVDLALAQDPPAVSSRGAYFALPSA